jgi:hypothetical protein
VVLFAEIPRRRRHDGSFADGDLAPLPNSLPNVVFANELGWFLDSLGRRAR